jgi:cytochrome c oxidase subunit 3
VRHGWHRIDGSGPSRRPWMTARKHVDPVRSRAAQEGHNAIVTSSATAARFESSRVHSLTRPNVVSVGTIVWLSSELMFFAGLFAMYFTMRSVHAGDWPMHLPDGVKIVPKIGYATPFTLILVASSFTCQWGVFAAERGDVFKLRRWFTLTFFMGLVFVLGQLNEFRMEYAEGNTISATGYGSVFYLTEGFHALHVIGGLIAFILFLARTALSKFTPAQATAAIVVSYYWHFVDVVWIGLFSIIYLIQ